MSKSDPSDQSRINLNDDADTIALKIRRAKTDPMPLPSGVDELADRPEARNLVGIYAAVSGTDLATVLEQHAGTGFGPFKNHLTELLVAELTPIAFETSRLLNDKVGLVDLLRLGGERAAAIADPIVSQAERLVGLVDVRGGRS